MLKTRVFGNKIYVDLEIGADGNETLREAHAVAEEVHNRIENEFPKVKHDHGACQSRRKQCQAFI